MGAMRHLIRSARAAAWALLAVLLLPAAALPQASLNALQADVDQIATHARPSLVTVFAQRPVEVKGRSGRIVRRTHTRVGSGVAVEEGALLTTASVVQSAQHIVVQTANGLQAEATVVGYDPIFNLALLRVPGLRLPPLPMAGGRGPQLGDWVIALGTSYGAQPTQSVGNVAYLHREPRFALLQLTNTVVPGNSGGAALNTRGELVGIVQGDLSAPDLAGGLDAPRPGGASFVIPLEIVRPVYESLRREGRVRHGYLGVTTRLVVVASDTELGMHVPLGALVESVVAGGPAERVGIRSGDLIVGFDRERVEYPEQLARWISASAPGTSVDLVWARNELQMNGRVALSESPDAAPVWAVGEIGPAGGSEKPRIAEIERQIQRLNQQLQSLKSQGVSTPP
jgi:serine protease Do